MVADTIMEGIIEVDIITTVDTDINLVTIITMVTDIIMVADIEHRWDIMVIIIVETNIRTVVDITKVASTTKRLDHELLLDNIDKHFYLSSLMRGNF
jgi:hypothetical protein